MFSPSSSLAARHPSRLRFGVDALAAAFGCPIVLPAQATEKTGFTAGSAEARAATLQALLRDDRIGAIICAAGGFNSAELLPLLDGALVEANPKIFVGYSDSTALLLGLQSIGGWVTYHGPGVLAQLGEYPEALAYTVSSLVHSLRSPSAPWTLLDPTSWTDEFLDWSGEEWLRRPRASRCDAARSVWQTGGGEGKLFGGNIETLNFLIGTPFARPADDIVLFFEANGEEAHLPRIRRALTHLKHAGILGKTKALLIGRSPSCTDVEGVSLRDVVLEVFAPLRVPVIADLPFGHTDPVATLPLGVTTKVEARKDGSSTIHFQPG